METQSGNSFAKYLKTIFIDKIFTNFGWPEWLGGLMLAILNIYFLAIAGKPFTIYGGFETWGRHIYSSLNLMALKESLFINKTSLGDIGLFLGALATAVLADEFKLKRSGIIEYLEGLIGGFLMALGVVLSWGCNWGGFFSAIIPLSLHGYAMFIGLIIGGYLGLLYVRWRGRRVFASPDEIELELMERSPTSRLEGISYGTKVTLALLVTIIVASLVYIGSGGGIYISMLSIGFGVGVVIQRSRFCFATAFREIFGGVEMRRAIRLQVGIGIGIIVGATGAAILKYMGFIDPGVYVKYVSISNVIGGVIFGFGMSIVGACASGSLWKAAEGNLKIFMALVAAVFSYPFLKLLRPYIVDSLNPLKVYIPSVLGYGVGLLMIYLSMLIWIIFLLYYAYRRGVRIYG